MTVAPVITIFVRHGNGPDGKPCKYSGDEFARRCNCRKHFRWTYHGTQYRRMAGTRSWEEAEELKRQLQDELAGRTSKSDESNKVISESIDLFVADKNVQGISDGVIGKYTLELDRLRQFCEKKSVYMVRGITRELLTEYCATWEAIYPSSTTRSKVRERLRSYLRYCYECKWLDRVPQTPRIIVDEPETMPLSSEEYTKLLDTVHGQIAERKQADRVHALFQLMRWSGLAIRDALTLERKEIIEHDAKKGLYRIVTDRQKTGVHVSVLIPPDVAAELLAVKNGNERYVFWSGEGEEESITKNWAKYYIAPIFKAAGLDNDGHMMSHRLRDTFAVELLQKGVPLEEVSKLLGHKSIKTTERSYAKWVKGRQDRLDSLVIGTWGD